MAQFESDLIGPGRGDWPGLESRSAYLGQQAPAVWGGHRLPGRLRDGGPDGEGRRGVARERSGRQRGAAPPLGARSAPTGRSSRAPRPPPLLLSSPSSSPPSAALAAQPFNLPFAEIQDAGRDQGEGLGDVFADGAQQEGGGSERCKRGKRQRGELPSSSSSSSPSLSSSNNGKPTPPRGITLLARDFQTVVAYNSKGAFAGIRSPGPGRPLTVEGIDIVIDDIVGSSGVELKADPGVPVVYAGFAGLMVSTLVSYLSHSQVWAWQESGRGGNCTCRDGRTGRRSGFEQELERALAEVPEVPGVS